MKVQYFSEFFTFYISLKFCPYTQEAEEICIKLACLQNVPDECNLITVIYLSRWGVDCASPDKSKLEWKLHFLEWKSRSLGVNKITISERPFQHFITILQLIDLITVFAAFLVGRQTILVSFFFRERRNRKETNGWKNKSHCNWALQIHLSRFVRKIVCPVSKNAIEEWFFFTFNIGQPCKQYNFQTCLRDNLVPRMLEMAFQSFQISKFSGGACPQTPLG